VARELEALLDRWVQEHLGPGQPDPLLDAEVVAQNLLRRRWIMPRPFIVPAPALAAGREGQGR